MKRLRTIGSGTTVVVGLLFFLGAGGCKKTVADPADVNMAPVAGQAQPARVLGQQDVD